VGNARLWSPIPDSYRTSREDLHQLAYFAVSPARYIEVGRMGLAPTHEGFGTPAFSGMVARVEEDLVVMERDGNTATQQISTVRSAAVFLAGKYEEVWFEDFHDPLTAKDPDAELIVDPQDTRLIGEWFEFAFHVINKLRGTGVDDDDVSEAQIWPEHFDAAAELGSAEAGRRASYGASPGDAGFTSPYIYVAPWGEFDKSDAFWNATSFGGALLGYEDLSRAEDPGSAALDFYRGGYNRLRDRDS
jgi:hypothetical protein